MLEAVHLDFIAIQSRRVKQKAFGLVRVGYKVRVLSHDTAKVANLLEEALFGAEVTTTEAPTP